MARVFVDDSVVGGLADGTSWPNAFSSIADADGAGSASGDEVRVRSTHNEIFGVSTTLDFTGGTLDNPVKIVSVTKGAADNGGASGARLFNETGSYDLTFDGHLYIKGCRFISTNNGTQILLGGSNDAQEFDDCTFTLSGGVSAYLTNSYGGLQVFRNCAVDVGFFLPQGRSTFTMIGGSLTTANATYGVSSGGTEITATFVGVDMTGVTGSKLIDAHEPDNRLRIIFRECLLQGAITIDPFTVRDSWVEFQRCSDSTNLLAPEIGLTWIESYEGRIKKDTTIWRNASDGTTPYTWSMETNLNKSREFVNPLESRPLTIMAAAGAQTLTVNVTSDTDLYDDEFWIEVISPNETASPNTTTQATTQSTRRLLMTARKQLSVAYGTSSGWAGTSKTYKLKVTASINPAVAGPISVRCFLAKTTVITAWVDPILEVV